VTRTIERKAWPSLHSCVSLQSLPYSLRFYIFEWFEEKTIPSPKLCVCFHYQSQLFSAFKNDNEGTFEAKVDLKRFNLVINDLIGKLCIISHNSLNLEIESRFK
jgi:hypothetical protein